MMELMYGALMTFDGELYGPNYNKNFYLSILIQNEDVLQHLA
jgi:hypothetical protein